jgi:hypothetical protein
MFRMRCLSVSLAVFSSFPVLAQAPDASRREESIIVAGTIEGKRVTITTADLAKLPRRSVTVKSDGGNTRFEGITVQSVLELAGVRFGEALKGDRLLVFIAVEGAPPPLSRLFGRQNEYDNNRVVFALAELDSSFAEQPVILAITRDGQPLSAPEGPFQIVAPQDKRQTRWVKDVRLIWVLHADYVLSP